MKIDQIFHHYLKWEDFKHGLYDSQCDRFEEKKELSKELLSNQELFYEVAIDMFKSWKFSSEQNLTDNNINKNAWIGQGSCCFNHSAPSYVTIEAWWELDEDTRKEANRTAQRALKKWRSEFLMRSGLWQS